MEWSRRDLLKTAAALVVEQWAGARHLSFGQAPRTPGRKVVVVTCGGIRREDTFSMEGLTNIPHLHTELLARGVFYPHIRNDGVTSHYNTISSILSGNWQRLDDWGKSRPQSPTIFEYLRKHMGLPSGEVWFISSNKALTRQIGASSVRQYGPEYGANVIFPKQLLINAVVHAAAEGRPVHGADRVAVKPELEALLSRDNYDGLGWSISDASSLDTPTLGAIQNAIDDLIRTNAPATGDEFTFLVSTEIMRRFAPSFMAITFSDMEVAHFGSYSLHLAGIRTMDRLVFELWNQIQELPAFKDRTTMLVLPEFGRDLDGSTTNGFFNHRQDSESTRSTWMMCVGEAVRTPTGIEQAVSQADICPTIARMFELKGLEFSGTPLPGLWL